MKAMEFTAPGPKIAVIITADNSAGKAKAKSLNRITHSSIPPPRAAARAPRGRPMPAPMPTATKATKIELAAPRIIIETTSRPY